MVTVLAPNVKTDDSIVYIIRVNGENCVQMNNKEHVINAIESIARHEADIYQKKHNHSKIFIEYSVDKCIAKIYMQSIGIMFNGSLAKVSTIDFVSIPIAFYSP